jgi:hypothetical protein
LGYNFFKDDILSGTGGSIDSSFDDSFMAGVNLTYQYQNMSLELVVDYLPDTDHETRIAGFSLKSGELEQIPINAYRFCS